MGNFSVADTLHRLAKQALDSGAAATVEEAEAILRDYRVGFAIDDPESLDAGHQAALLTAVALGRRVFLGGVTVTGRLDVPLLTPMPLGETLASAVTALGGVIGPTIPGTPTIVIGGPPRPRAEGFNIRALAEGWRGGIVPAHADFAFATHGAMPLAAMLSAALAVSEAFSYVRKEGGAIGQRPVGVSLWQPSAEDWFSRGTDEPALEYLPSRLWLIGLGHLGQAYLWGLGLLPYARTGALSLVLQDVDVMTPSTESTSVLTQADMTGEKKTRAMAAWAERRGFATAILERLFDAQFRRQSDEPAVALCGLDNAIGRRALDQVGFDFVVEAGLGRGYRNFRTMRLHTFPATRAAAEIWKASDVAQDLSDRPAYRRLLKDGTLDQCGVTLLAGKAVGAPFVGAVAACLALSEILRLLHGGPLYQVADIDLQSLEHRSFIAQSRNLSELNPGYVSPLK